MPICVRTFHKFCVVKNKKFHKFCVVKNKKNETKFENGLLFLFELSCILHIGTLLFTVREGLFSSGRNVFID